MIVIGTIIINWFSIIAYGIGLSIKAKLRKKKIIRLRKKYDDSSKSINLKSDTKLEIPKKDISSLNGTK